MPKCFVRSRARGRYYYAALHLFNGLFSRTSWVSLYRKGTTTLDLNKVRDDGVLGWPWHQLDHMQTICISLQTERKNKRRKSRVVGTDDDSVC